MTWIIVGIFIITILAVIALKLRIVKEQQPEYPYRKLDTLFSPAERSFLGVLNQVIDENAQVFGKVRIADVITPKKGMSRSNWQKAFNKISGKHFDFLLCNKDDLSVLCAVELNDSSHQSKKRKERDVFLEGVCQSANVPLVQITAKLTYKINEIQALIVSHPPGISISKAIPSSSLPIEVPLGEKTCPKCSSKMVRRVAKKGKNVGKQFWACSAFPKCRYTEEINA